MLKIAKRADAERRPLENLVRHRYLGDRSETHYFDAAALSAMDGGEIELPRGYGLAADWPCGCRTAAMAFASSSNLLSALLAYHV